MPAIAEDLPVGEFAPIAERTNQEINPGNTIIPAKFPGILDRMLEIVYK